MLRRILLLTILSGSVIGAVGTELLPAWAQQAATPRAYYVADFELKDPEGIRPYAAGIAATLEPFGGRFIARGGRIAALEGPPPGARSVIIEFPSLERAQAWYDSDAYRALRPFRQQSGISRTYIIEGLAN